MKKLLVFILCLGLTFAFGACDLFNDTTSSNSQPESLGSVDNSGVTDASTGGSSDDSSSDSSDDSSDDSSSATPPIIDGDNEMPLVPIG